MGHVEERLRRLATAARESKKVADEDRDARDVAIEEADADGWGLQAISRATGLSVSHVQRIVVVRTAKRQEAHERASAAAGAG